MFYSLTRKTLVESAQFDSGKISGCLHNGHPSESEYLLSQYNYKFTIHWVTTVDCA